MGDSRQVEVPSTTFPRLAGSPPSVSAQNTAHDLEHLPAQDPVSLDGQLLPFLIVSDASECNNNLSCFLKEVIYVLYGVRCDRNPNTGTNTETASPADRPAKNYQRISGFALKLVTLNLFTKNNILCIGKLLGLLVALSHLSFQDEEARYEGECLEEFICITLLILLKTADKSGGKKTVLLVLEDLNFIGILFGFLTTHIGTIESSSKATDTESATVLPSLTSSSSSSSSYIILKFVCDLVFEYLFLVEHLSDNEFQMLSLETDLIPTLLKHLLENDDFNNYDNTELGNDDDDVGDTKAIAYEEFKLLLLINEQYLMKSYTRPEITNKVFETLLEQSSSSSTATIPGFLNMVVCYLNREESLILKILILKFFYLIFTTSTTAKQFYLNDLKILVDIFIRELNNMEYDDSALGNSNRLLTITYLKVMYPLLVFSQLSEEIEGVTRMNKS